METFTDDTVVALASFLSPCDMLNLALTCKRFGDRNGTTTNTDKNDRRIEERVLEVRQKVENISLMENAARTLLHTKWTDEEKNALPRRGEESWIGLYQEFLLVFRLPLQFDKLVGRGINYVDSSDKTKVCSNVGVPGTAICSNIMRSGKHSVSFQVNGNIGVLFGIMRPTTKDITSLRKCHPARDDLSLFSLKDYKTSHTDNSIDCCLLDTCMGNGLIRRRWKEWKESELMGMDREQRFRSQIQAFNWEGQERTFDTSYKIGFVLDLDEGTLDAYKNGRRLGTMMTHLTGEYCWVVQLSISGREVSVSIDR